MSPLQTDPLSSDGPTAGKIGIELFTRIRATKSVSAMEKQSDVTSGQM